jgi:hypothetical protein
LSPILLTFHFLDSFRSFEEEKNTNQKKSFEINWNSFRDVTTKISMKRSLFSFELF